jgi:Domain of unknown function (DUF4332)
LALADDLHFFRSSHGFTSGILLIKTVWISILKWGSITMNASFLLSSPAVIEGIGPARADALKASGIETIAEMFAAGARRVHQMLPRTGPRQVGSWFVAAQLLRVDDMTPNLAEALVDAGIRSVPQLAEAGLRTVELAVDRALNDGKLQEKPSLYNLAGLQRDAWRVRERGMLAGRILTPDGNPIAGAEVRAGRYETVTFRPRALCLSSVACR